MPKVSVIMAAYNEEKYIKEAVNSILKQSFKDFELIIVDDGSKDRTSEILAGYDKEQLKIIHQENQGHAAARNKAIQLSSGEYIANLDANDISMPQRLKRQVAFLDQNSEIGMVGSAFIEIGERIQGRRLAINPTSDQGIREMLVKLGCPLIHPSVMFRRSVIEKVGMYDEKLKNGADIELFGRIMKHFKVANLEEPLVIVRRNWDGITGDVLRNLKLRLSMNLFIYRISRSLISTPRQYIYLIIRIIGCLIPYGIKKFFKEHLVPAKAKNTVESGTKRIKIR